MRLSCPITHQLFTDPVMASDGFLYERTPIERWFLAKGTSPLTRARIDGVFHAVPSVRAEVAAFLASMDMDARRRWRRWARTAVFQATIDALERELVPKINAVPIEWRRLMHVADDDWAEWMAEAERCASVSVDAARRNQETPEGTAAAKIGRRYGWTEEAMANVWHQLPALAAQVVDPDDNNNNDDDAADANYFLSTSALVYRAVVRLLAYVDVTCAGYIMAGPAVARCAETEAWTAATAIVRNAAELDTNILVRTLSASFADSKPGWRLIAEVCRRELGGEGGGNGEERRLLPSSSPRRSVKRSRSFDTRSSHDDVDDERSDGGLLLEEEDEQEQEQEEEEAAASDDETMMDEDLEDMEGELLNTGEGFMVEVTRRDSSGSDEEEEEEEPSDGGYASSSSGAEQEQEEEEPVDDDDDPADEHRQAHSYASIFATGVPRGMPATFGQVTHRSRAEEQAFQAAMATVDSRADGLFSYDDHDDRRHHHRNNNDRRHRKRRGG